MNIRSHIGTRLAHLKVRRRHLSVRIPFTENTSSLVPSPLILTEEQWGGLVRTLRSSEHVDQRERDT